MSAARVSVDFVARRSRLTPAGGLLLVLGVGAVAGACLEYRAIESRRAGLELRLQAATQRSHRDPAQERAAAALTEEAGLTATPATRHRGLAFGDLDGDGRIDVVTTALAADAEIWMNRSPKSGHWLEIALQGTKSNRDGIGARIKVVTKSGTQYNHMTTSVGYASSSDGPVHFGLGAAESIDKIQIHWPSGREQTLEKQAVDRVITVEEPK